MDALSTANIKVHEFIEEFDKENLQRDEVRKELSELLTQYQLRVARSATEQTACLMMQAIIKEKS